LDEEGKLMRVRNPKTTESSEQRRGKMVKKTRAFSKGVMSRNAPRRGGKMVDKQRVVFHA